MIETCEIRGVNREWHKKTIHIVLEIIFWRGSLIIHVCPTPRDPFRSQSSICYIMILQAQSLSNNPTAIYIFFHNFRIRILRQNLWRFTPSAIFAQHGVLIVIAFQLPLSSLQEVCIGFQHVGHNLYICSSTYLLF